MNAPTKLLLVAAGVAIACAQPAIAQTVTPSKQWNGTWKLNPAKSRLSKPAAKLSETRSYKIEGGKVTMNSTGTDRAGKPIKYSYTASYDGKFYPMPGNYPGGDSIALKLVNDRQVRAMVRKQGKNSVQAAAEVAADGKTLTIKRRMLSSPPTDETLTYNRVK